MLESMASVRCWSINFLTSTDTPLFLQSTQHLPSKDMCTAELIGDYYRGCQHFVGLYYTGERTDCNSPKCGVSAAHRHTAPNCPCPKQDEDDRKVEDNRSAERGIFLLPLEGSLSNCHLRVDTPSVKAREENFQGPSRAQPRM
ncbi:hypothetical protein AB1N83_001803 [Pleurotus pulmonarius]